nr:glycosyltransferase family 39 protein [Chloroflexota bacterium]
MPLRRYATPVIVLLLATALRLYHLDFRALWWDEGLSLFFARLSFWEGARMAVTLADTNPPVYRMLLGGWLGMAGWSAFAARLFSMLPGVALVALVYPLARRLRCSRAVSLAAMALCAASPMLIYYSQEAKGYSLVAAAGTASVLIWLGLHRGLPRGGESAAAGKGSTAVNGWRRTALWAAWAASLLLVVGSHYISVFLIAVENLWTLALTARSWRGNERRWLAHWAWQAGAQALAAAALLPFVLATFGGTSAAVQGQTGQFAGLDGPAQFFGRHLIELTQGPTAQGPWAWAVALAVAALAVAGSGRWEVGSGKLVSWVAVPLLLGFALNAYHQFFFPRFVLYTVPALIVLAANGISRITDQLSRAANRRPSPLIVHYSSSRCSLSHCSLFIVSFFIVSFWIPTLVTHYAAPGDPLEDWRPVADAMRPLARSGDLAIYGWGWMPGYLDAYLPPAPRPDYALGFFTPQSLDPGLTALTTGRTRVWMLDYKIDQFDVRNPAGRWLGERAALVYDEWPGGGNAHVALFALTPTAGLTGATIDTTFANGLRLIAPELHAQLAAGDALVLALRWEATRAIPNRATVFLHALAADGSLAFGRDSEPRNGLDPVSGWQPGAARDELRGVLIPPGTPAGTYTIQLGVYD